MIYGDIQGVGKPVSRLVLGSMVFSPERMELATSLLDAFVEAGGTAVDTANAYGRGASERAFGMWLRERGCRDRIVVVDKGAHLTPEGVRRVNPAAISQDLAESLDRLQVESIDLYLLHRDDPDHPVGPIVECLNEHAAAGRIRAFGGSNWGTRRLGMANVYAAAHGLCPFVASSPNLALAIPSEPMWRECVSVAGDAEALAWYRDTRFPLLAWSSQASGFFSGRFAPGQVDDPNVARVYDRPDNWERLRRARELATRHGCTPTQVALAWVLHQPLNLFALIGPRTLSELADCLGALGVRLSPEEVDWLNLGG
ncbi:MAG: aldo/keto reductase [Chloroflexi bacterium]|nr:aldo/keto reductase [Chloroflexota bacterium]